MDPNADGDALTVRLTLHSGSDTTARDEARERVEDALRGKESTEWAIEAVEIVEPPTAPFEPHTIAVRIAGDESEAIEAALAEAGIDRISVDSR